MADISFPSYLFHEGTNYRSYEYLGVNLNISNGQYVYTFRVWAPNALSVGLISDFSGWEHPIFMTKVTSNGVFELIYTSDHSLERCPYKYRIYTSNGVFDKGDPYAAFSRGSWDGASLIFTENHFVWSDEIWMAERHRKLYTGGDYLSAPINIYEMHLGSFVRHFDNKYYSYTQLAEILPPYLKEMGYTHVEFLPIQEFPYDGSWGYQVCGFFSPTSRFGDPDEFRHLINALHSAGIGVILDWVCAHFSKDNWGLSQFDGTFLYEYTDEEKREAVHWGTSFFDLTKPEVQSFLISNALYFLREFHIDGLRMDAVSSLLYLDCGRAGAKNIYGANENLEGAEFFKKLNSAISKEFPDAIIIAEESTPYSGTTSPIFDGGLGFDMKWNMGWAHDFFDYVSTDPIFRASKHRALNFPLVYAFDERHCMPISHDDVSFGKSSFIGKMFGSYEDKFDMARLSLMLMMTYPGKKLLFMGTEFAQLNEWNYDHELDWFLLGRQNHKSFKEYTAALNHFYLSTPELWQLDFSPNGFEWIYPDEADKNIVAFKRKASTGNEIIVILNFSGIEQEVAIPIYSNGNYQVIFDTGNTGGENIYYFNSDNRNFASIRLAKYSGVIIKLTNF